MPVAFPADTVEDPIGKVLSDAGLTQLRLAETYKYAHVTYFFNGLREAAVQRRVSHARAVQSPIRIRRSIRR